jgi:methionyl-tRNA formyltransferase
MKILFLGNNYAAAEILAWLTDRGEEIAALVVHPPGRERHRDAIVKASRLPEERILSADLLKTGAFRAQVRSFSPDIGISVFFGYILDRGLLDLLPKGCINVHPACLPYNRGAYPNVWSIVEGTPAGVTIHCVDEGIDTGPVLARREVEVLPTDTGASLYHRLEQASIDLFTDTWPQIAAGAITPVPQSPREGTVHRVQDVEAIDRIDPDAQYSARRLIDILRARTFPPYRGAYFLHEGRKIYLKLELEEEK